MKSRQSLRSFLFLAGSSLLAVSYSHAASTWNAGTAVSTDGLWATATNWSADTAPIDGADLIFDGAENKTNTNSIPLTSIGSLTLNNAGWNITAGTLTLGGGITAAGSATVDGTLTLGAPQTWSNTTGTLTVSGTVANGANLLTVSGAGSTTISAILGNGAGGLTKDGAGTLTLSGANTYSGTTTLTAGTLQGLVVGTSLTPVSPLGTSSLALNSGTLQLRASGTVNTTAENITLGNNTTVGGTTTIDVNRPGATSTKKTLIMGTLGIGAQTLNVTGANSYVLRYGATTASGAAIFNPTSAPLTLDSLTLDNSVTTATTTTITLGGTSAASAISGIISDNSVDSTKKLAIQKSGAGNWTLTGASTYSGGTTLSAGNLIVASNSALGSGPLGTGTLTFDGNATLSPAYLSAGYTIANNVMVNPLVTATIDAPNQFYKLTSNSPVQGSGTLAVTASNNGRGSVILSSAANTFTGTLKVGSTNGVTLVVNSLADSAVLNTNPIQIWRDTATGDGSAAVPLTLGTGTASPLLFNNRQIELMGTTTGATIKNANGTATNTITINTDLKVTGVGNKTLTLGGTNTGANAFNGSIADAAGSVIRVTKVDAGLWALGGANNYTGPTTLTGGTLSVGSSDNLGASASNLVFNGGTLRITGTALTNFSTIGHTVSFTAATAVGLDIDSVSHTFTADQVLNQTTGGLTKAGAGTLVLNQANTYSGATAINAGALEAADGTGLPTSSILQLRGGVFQSSGTFSRAVSTAAGAVNWATSSGGFAAKGAPLVLNLNGGTTSVTWNGSSMVPTGQTLIFGSTSADSLVDFQNGLKLAASGNNNLNRTILVNDNTGSTTDIARISGAITSDSTNNGIIKTGAGTLELTNTNTYTGATTVSAGRLTLGVDDCLSNSSNVVIGAGTLNAAASVDDTVGTLDVTAAATINLESGATLAFADSYAVDWTDVPGTLNITGAFVSGSSLKFGDGTPGTGLNPSQLAAITINGVPGSYTLDSSGFLTSGGGPGPVDNFLISAIASPQTVGTPITGITITARDSSNATATGFTGTVTFGGTGGFTGTSGTFTAGVLSGVSVTPTVAGSNLTFTVDDGASHTGSVTISTIQTQYQGWAGGAAFNADANGDGVSNGMAFLLGAGGPSSAVTQPTITQSSGSLVLSNFSSRNSASRGTATLSVQHSSDLGISDAWTTVAVPETSGGPTSGVTFNITPGSPLNTVNTATISVGEAASGKLFGRLRATE